MAHHRTGRGAITQQDFAMFDAGCRGKMRFTSKRQAKGKLRVKRKQETPDERRQPMSEYKCRECSGWHFGHTPAHLRKPIA